MTVNMTTGQQPHTRFRREMPKRKTKTMMGTSWKICHSWSKEYGKKLGWSFGEDGYGSFMLSR